jgi:dipeptidyl aminopeptidase/acylaminoacyl peptidase
MINELILAGSYPADLMILPGRGHSMGDWQARIQLYQRITDFILRNL